MENKCDCIDDSEFIEEEIEIGQLEELIKDNIILIDTPDGWQAISAYVEKGEYDGYKVTTENGYEVITNANHLLQTRRGWICTQNILKNDEVLTKNGWSTVFVKKTNDKRAIVDIQVEHPNHRYWSAGISSHNTGVGKSLIKCHLAANCLTKNYNVLYITLEMQEKMIAKRIDANLFGVDLDDLDKLDKETYERKVRISTTKTKGRLYIKEYAPTTASVSHFKHLLSELKLKKKFVPDIIFVDYLNLCASSRVKLSNSINSYTLIKSVAEELRSMAVEYDVPVVSSTQTNRQGMGNTDVDMTNVSESIGLPATCDLMIAAIRNEQLDSMNQILFKQLKNRYSDLAKFNKFVVGVDRSKMKLYDVSESAQTMLNSGIDAVSQPSNSSGYPAKSFSNTKKGFGGFNV